MLVYLLYSFLEENFIKKDLIFISRFVKQKGALLYTIQCSAYNSVWHGLHDDYEIKILPMKIS